MFDNRKGLILILISLANIMGSVMMLLSMLTCVSFWDRLLTKRPRKVKQSVARIRGQQEQQAFPTQPGIEDEHAEVKHILALPRPHWSWI